MNKLLINTWDSNYHNIQNNIQDMSILNECSDIIKSLMTNDHSWPFLKPISKKIVSYLKIRLIVKNIFKNVIFLYSL